MAVGPGRLRASRHIVTGVNAKSNPVRQHDDDNNNNNNTAT